MKKLMLLSLMLGALPLTMMAQDDDDMYFVPTKKAVEKQQMTHQLPRNTYYPGSNRNVDEYNRRTKTGHFYRVLPDSTASDIIDFDGQQGVYPDSVQQDSVQQDFELTKRMSRWEGYEPSQSYWDGYVDGRRDAAWHSPWYYNSFYPWYDSYWYDPWYWDRWYLYHGIYDPWYWDYYGYYGYYGWNRPWYYGYGYGYYAPYYPGYAYAPSGPTGTQNHGRINYDGPRGLSNGRSTAYGAGTFGGSRAGTTNRSAGVLGSRNGVTRTNSTATQTDGRTTNAYGNFGGSRARTASSNNSSTRTYTPTTTTSSSSYSSGSSSGGSFGGGSFGGSSSGGSFGGSRSSGGGGGGGGHFGGRR